MKLFTYILAIYMVSFTAFISLADVISHACCNSSIVALHTPSTDSETAELKNDSEDSDGKDCCGGDLCGCSCCHATVFYPAGIASSLHTTSQKTFHFSPYQSFLSKGEYFIVWQPPSFIS